MPYTQDKYAPSNRTYAAIVALDPAGVADAGCAARVTATLPDEPVLENLRSPDFQYQGPLFDTRFSDELTLWLARNVMGGGKVLLAYERSGYRSMTTVLSIGSGIGRVRGLLQDLGVAGPADAVWVAPRTFRKWNLGEPLPKGRDDLKRAAVDCVARRYGVAVKDDLAEAICLLDYVTVECPGEWL